MTDQASGSPQTVDYAALVKGARAGDKAAFTALYEATHKEIFRTIRAMVRTEDQALDIQQDAYVQAFTHLEQLTAPERFRPWMRSIAVNQTRLALRKQTPVLFSELSAEDEEEASQLAEIADLRPEASPELHMERKECAAYVQEVLDELTPGQRMLVGMYYYDQRPMREIAQELSLNLGTVKSQLSRTRKKIEAAVLRLEKKGVKLYGLSPLPFLFAMIQRLSPAESTEKAVLDGALSQSGAAAETVALQLGRPFFETVAGKVVLGVLAAGVLCGGIFGYRLLRSSHDYGDVRPPAGVETAEDLSTEPTQITEPLWAVTPEDLPTEPETTAPTEPETTAPAVPDPEATEPQPTEPGAQPAEPGPEPTEPTQSSPETPTEESSAPSGEPEPDDGPPDPFADPAVPPVTEPIVLTPQIESCTWEGGGDALYDQPWGSSTYIRVLAKDGAVPTLYTDNAEVIQLQADGYFYSDTDDRVKIYTWIATFLGPGEARVYCAWHGTVTHVLQVENPDHPNELLRLSVNAVDEPDLVEYSIGTPIYLTSLTQGTLIPELSSDNPAVLDFGARTVFISGDSSWICTLYAWTVQLHAAGTAHVTVWLDGKAVRTVTFVVKE